MKYELLNRMFGEMEKTHEKSLLDHFETIVKDEAEVKVSVKAVMEKLGLTAVQSVVFAHFLNLCADQARLGRGRGQGRLF